VIPNNLNDHHAIDVLLFSRAHLCWELVFQPSYAAYLNVTEPWWKVLRPLALKGCRFETREQVCQAVNHRLRMPIDISLFGGTSPASVAAAGRHRFCGLWILLFWY
jgi:hypothetical protein